MATRKPTKTEAFVNILFWAAMTISVVGLFIYGAFQIYLWRNEKPFHFFKLGSKKTKTSALASTEEDETEKSEQSQKSKKPKKQNVESEETREKPNPPSTAALDMEYIDQELKVVVNEYISNNRGKTEYLSWLKIDFTPTHFGLHTLMHESDPEAYSALMVQRGKYIMRILQARHGVMEWNFNCAARPPGFWPEIIISSAIPQSLLDHYSKLPKSPLYTWYPDDLLQKIINFSPKPEDENAKLIIDLEPAELAGHTYYVNLNSFIEETKNPDFKRQAFEQMTDRLAKYLAEKYKVELMYDEENDQYYIPQEQRWQLEINANLSALNPPFSALAAKRLADRTKALQDKNESKKSTTKDEEKQNLDEDSDSQSHCSK